jgi:hypothetical protein
MKTNLKQLMLLACFMLSFVACTIDSGDNPAKGIDTRIVGNWFSDVSGMTYAKWNYGKTWQNTEFKADGTGSTRIYYTFEDDVIGCEKIDFTYTASANGVLTMNPKDREKMYANWQLVGDELTLGDDIDLKFKKTTSDMAAKFDTWSKDDEMIDVPQPAKYTVFVYGNAGGTMDFIIEQGLWERLQQYLTDHNNVRVVCMYKYGKDLPDPDKAFTGKYAAPGDIVWFELTGETDLNTIKEQGMQAIGMGEQAKQLKICDPNTMRMFLEFSSLLCPAEDYVMGIWGHGSGFDAMYDVPGKYEVQQARATRGVMVDEWVDNEWMDMYELNDAMKAAGIEKFNTLMFHNCFMGNIETLTQARSLADYIFASAHILSSGGELMTEFIRGLAETGDAQKAGKLMFERCTPEWQNSYVDVAKNVYANGDYKMIRTDKFEPIIDAAKQLCDRILALYPTQKEAIDRATKSVYRFEPIDANKNEFIYPFFDIANYAQLLAKETDDAELKAISAAMDKAFDEAFVCYRDVNNSKEHLDHYTLSICLMSKLFYTFDYMTKVPELKALNNYNEGYEKCDFHKLTGWGNWLKTNEQFLNSNPQKGGGGKLE